MQSIRSTDEKTSRFSAIRRFGVSAPKFLLFSLSLLVLFVHRQYVTSAEKASTGSDGLFPSGSPVTVFSAADFRKKVLNSNDLWIVEFFAGWCGHCKAFAPEFERAARALKGIVNLAAVEDQSVMADFGVKGFPTVKAFICNGGKSSPKIVDYNGAMTASALVEFVLDQLKDLVKTRLGGGKGAKGGSGRKSGGGGSDVIVLTDNNFDKQLMKDDKNAWFVEFYAPWCGHCKNLAPDWEKLASEVKGKVMVAKVDATTETVLAKKFDIQGFPSLRMFPAGEKSVKKAIDYSGPRSVNEMTTFAMKFHSLNIVAEQLVSEEQFRESCSKRLCVLVFLPHIYESKAKLRKQYINDLNLVAKASTPGLFTFFWSQGGDQVQLEEQLNLAFGYPAVVAVSVEKQMYAVHRGDFSQESMLTFLRMKGPVDPLPKQLKEIVSVEKWDGKDAVPPKEPQDEL